MISIARGFGLLILCGAVSGCALRSACEPAPYMEARARAELVIPAGMDVPERRYALRVPAPGSVGGRIANDPADCIIEPPDFYGAAAASSGSPRSSAAPSAASPAAGPTEEVGLFLQEWVERWNRRDADGWLPLYAPDYAPSGYAGPEEWRADQQRRFEVPASTRIDFDTLAVDTTADGLVRARFVQRFGQPPEERGVRKELVLLQGRDGAWLIVDEQIIEVL